MKTSVSVCHSCGQQVPGGSAFCPFCGTKIADNIGAPGITKPVIQSAQEDERSARPKKKKKTWLIVLLLALVLLAGTAGAYYHMYDTSKKFAAQGDFTKAEQYLIVPDVTNLHDPYLYDYIVAGKNYDAGDYSLAKDQFQKLTKYGYLDSEKMYDAIVEAEYQKEQEDKFLQAKKDVEQGTNLLDAATLINEFVEINYPGAQELKEAALKKIYSDLETHYTAKKYKEAANDSEIIALFDPDYKDTSKYNKLLAARGVTGNHLTASKLVSDLLSIYDFKDAKKLLFLNTDIAAEYLKGTWRGNNGMYFTMKSDGNCNYNVPWYNVHGYYYIVDGLYYVAESANDPVRTDVFRFTSVSKDKIDVYAFRTNTTYRLTKQ